jgi:hypothetical protein
MEFLKIKTGLVLLLSIIAVQFMSCNQVDGNSPEDKPLVYTGLTTPAKVTMENGVEITNGAYFGGQASENLGSFSVKTRDANSTNNTDLPIHYRIRKTLVNYIKKSAEPLYVSLRSTQTESKTVNGPCGGTVSSTLTMDDQTLEFSGSVVFSDFCEDGITLSGSISIAGIFSTKSVILMEFNMSFKNVSVVSQSESFSMEGNISVAIQDDLSTISTSNSMLRDNNSGIVNKVENLVIKISSPFAAASLEISGRFYHSLHGYVDISTPVPFQMGSTGTIIEGEFMVTGTNQSKAKMTIVSNQEYKISVDSDGDGTFEWDTTLNW